MRVVIYSAEDLEPITVINLPITERDLEQRGMLWRVHVSPQISATWSTPDERPTAAPPPHVELQFERFMRGKQFGFMCFTNADALAMRLVPDWLPGQRGAVRAIERERDLLAKLLLASIAP